jgi:arylsulfatase A
MRTVLTFLALLLSIALIGLGTLVQAAESARKPNVIFILADDLGQRDIGCYGSTFHRTPHIDALARRGMKFTNGYSASPLCSPTRASILTGLHPAHRHHRARLPCQ